MHPKDIALLVIDSIVGLFFLAVMVRAFRKKGDR